MSIKLPRFDTQFTLFDDVGDQEDTSLGFKPGCKPKINLKSGRISELLDNEVTPWPAEKRVKSVLVITRAIITNFEI